MRPRTQQYQIERITYRIIELLLKLLIGIAAIFTLIPLLIGATLVYILHEFQLRTGMDNSPLLTTLKRWYDIRRKTHFNR
jgi:hypothetical protein